MQHKHVLCLARLSLDLNTKLICRNRLLQKYWFSLLQQHQRLTFFKALHVQIQSCALSLSALQTSGDSLCLSLPPQATTELVMQALGGRVQKGAFLMLGTEGEVRFPGVVQLHV